MSINPFSTSNIFLLLITTGLVIYLFFLWQFARRHATPDALNSFQKPTVRFVTIYTFYFVLISVLAANGFFNVITLPPRFLLIFLPLLFIIVLLSRAKQHHSLRFLQFLPPVSLIAVHVYRLFIELVFVQFASEKIIPAELSIHGRNYDLWIGVFAVPVGLLFLRKHKAARKAGIAFNVIGLLSLANIFSIAVPSMPSTFRIYETLYLPTYFPGITIVFLASAAIFLHILSLRQLLALKTVYHKEANSIAAGKTLLVPQTKSLH